MTSKKTTIFNKKQLEELPITYRLMNEMETENVGELYLKSVFTNSKKHYSKSYKMYISSKPISNYIIKKDE